MLLFRRAPCQLDGMHRHYRLLPLMLLWPLAACSDDRGWTAYALRDGQRSAEPRILGDFQNDRDCRAGALAANSDPDNEALVCTRGCPRMTSGPLDGCAETVVVRIPDATTGATPPDRPIRGAPIG